MNYQTVIDAAERAGFEMIVTTDKNIRYQQNLTGRKIALVVLEHLQWPMVKLVADKIAAAVNAATPAAMLRLQFPSKIEASTLIRMADRPGTSGTAPVFWAN